MEGGGGSLSGKRQTLDRTHTWEDVCPVPESRRFHLNIFTSAEIDFRPCTPGLLEGDQSDLSPDSVSDASARDCTSRSSPLGGAALYVPASCHTFFERGPLVYEPPVCGTPVCIPPVCGTLLCGTPVCIPPVCGTLVCGTPVCIPPACDPLVCPTCL